MPGAPDPSRPPTDRVVHRSAHCAVGIFDLPRDHELWRTENRITLGALIAIPWTAVVIDRDGARHELMDPSRVAYYSPGQAYARRPVSARGDRCVFVVPSPALLRDALEESGLGGDGDRYPFATGPADPRVTRAQHLLIRALTGAQPPTPLEIDDAVTRIVRRLVAGAAAEAGRRRSRGVPLSRAHRELVARARRAMNARIESGRDASLTVNELADLVESSPFHLSRVFRDLTGESLARHYRSLRLRFAAESVGHQPAPLTGLALRLGFSSHAHFSAAWRAEFGDTPSAFRRARI